MKIISLDYFIKNMEKGSKSFAVATKLFNSSVRYSVLMLYAWCRYCDDVIDGQLFGMVNNIEKSDVIRDVQIRMFRLRIDAIRAYNGEYMENPAFKALQEIILMNHFPSQLLFDHLEGFAMDVRNECYFSFEDTLRYCYHVAGVVGLMMAYIMGINEEVLLDRACDLGIAFQLTNIARDIIEDAVNGRCYLPQQWLDEVGLSRDLLVHPKYRIVLSSLATRLIREAEPYYLSAYSGLSFLSFRSACAVATACVIYREIGVKVTNAGVRAWDERQCTNKNEKIMFLFKGIVKAVSSRFVFSCRSKLRSKELWQRPMS